MKDPTETLGTPVSYSHPLTRKIRNHPIFGHMHHVWCIAQEGGHEVTRWNGWREENPELHLQNLFQHQLSFLHLVNIMLMRVRACGGQLDEALVLRSVLVHDVAETIIRRDMAAPQKKGVNDLQEYLAFKEHFQGLGDIEWRELQENFLLQTAIKNDPCFPDDARDVMSWLMRNHRQEAYFFYGMEGLDYLHTAYRGTCEDGIDHMIYEIANGHLGRLEEVSRQVVGFSEGVWTAEVQAYFAEKAAAFRANPNRFRPRQLVLELEG